MKISMTIDMATFLGLIEDSLQYLKSVDNRVVLPEVNMLKKGLDKQGIKNCLKYLLENDIAQNEIGYAPEVTQSKKGVGYATHTSMRTREYNQVDYILQVNRKKIIPLFEQARKLRDKQKSVGGGNSGSRLVEKDVRGNYLYDGQKIEVSKEPMYYKAFDILLSNADQDGFLSYADIEKALVKSGVPEAENEKTRNKRINNVLKNEQDGFFRYAKVNGKSLKNKTLDGNLLIKVIRGKGLQLNNPKL